MRAVAAGAAFACREFVEFVIGKALLSPDLLVDQRLDAGPGRRPEGNSARQVDTCSKIWKNDEPAW